MMVCKHIRLVLLVWFSFTEVSFAQTSVSELRELQVAYIYNFAKYIQWPNDYETFVVGVLGDEKLVDCFKKLEDKKIGGKPIVIRFLQEGEEVDECNILYVAESGFQAFEKLQLSEQPVLIVTEDDLITKGALISFTVVNNILKFKLKKSAVEDSGLVISQGLLKLAIVL